MLYVKLYVKTTEKSFKQYCELQWLSCNVPYFSIYILKNSPNVLITRSHLSLLDSQGTTKQASLLAVLV